MINFGVTEKKMAELTARMAHCGLREEDLIERFVRSSGPGGQRVNKTSSCVYLKHEPTGFEVKMQQSRDQKLNRFLARRRMCERIEVEILGEKSPVILEQEKRCKQKQRRRRRTKVKELDRQCQDALARNRSSET